MSFLALFVVGVILGLGFNVYALLACCVIVAPAVAAFSFSSGVIGAAFTVVWALASLQAGYVIGLLASSRVTTSRPTFGQSVNLLGRIAVAFQMLRAGRGRSRPP